MCTYHSGLLAGLFEPPSQMLADTSTNGLVDDLKSHASTFLKGLNNAPSIVETRGEYLHVFSHIKMTYRLSELIIDGTNTALPDVILPQDKQPGDVVWVDKQGLQSLNVGTGVKKMWELLLPSTYPWVRTGTKKKSTSTKPAKVTATKICKTSESQVTGKNTGEKTKTTTVKKVMMPMMPTKTKPTAQDSVAHT